MQYAHNPPNKRQLNGVPVAPSADGVVGGTTATSVGPGSSLLLGTSGSPVPSVSNALSPNEPLLTVTESSSPTQTSSTPTSSAALSPTHSSISTGAVLGISAGVFAVAVAAMFAVYTLFKKRTYTQARRPLTRGSPPTSRAMGGSRGSNGDNKWERLEGGDKPLAGEVNSTAPPKTPEIGKFELFEKDPSLRSVSDEKANNTFDPAAMPNFVQYPNLVEDLSTAPPSRPFATGVEGSPVVSWGGETVADSFLSFRTSDSMSPSAVMARQTPRTTDSAQHRWESAEVLIMDEPVTERPSVYSEITQNPFRDDDNSRASLDGNEADTRASSSNPFFNASQHNPFSDQSSRSRSRKSSVSTVKRSRSNSVASRGTVRAGAGGDALLSLIAALDTKHVLPEDQSNRVSMQTTTTSIYTVEGGAAPPTPKAF
ncbi:hypothetical protein EDB92DRAFT_785671 [Lactarius akahatsu]|uniref:Uncharacterized protein n=1 Tax=Lactarius akahatsu TaxID=416441 RepID=A0AAD4LE94_9AGAM|nr:hypothetical protein EDB92DRAFT_785671 [Lactarius akahatsu]